MNTEKKKRRKNSRNRHVNFAPEIVETRVFDTADMENSVLKFYALWNYIYSFEDEEEIDKILHADDVIWLEELINGQNFDIGSQLLCERIREYHNMSSTGLPSEIREILDETIIPVNSGTTNNNTTTTTKVQPSLEEFRKTLVDAKMYVPIPPSPYSYSNNNATSSDHNNNEPLSNADIISEQNDEYEQALLQDIIAQSLVSNVRDNTNGNFGNDEQLHQLIEQEEKNDEYIPYVVAEGTDDGDETDSIVVSIVYDQRYSRQFNGQQKSSDIVKWLCNMTKHQNISDWKFYTNFPRSQIILDDTTTISTVAKNLGTNKKLLLYAEK